ncbi:MAG TPA: hypothetical protein VK507_04150 [Iamia sp.]|nr:hypothetical protein [Iamia sp.]
MGIFSNAFGAGNGGENDIDQETLRNLPKSQRARHYDRQEKDANKGKDNGQVEPRDGKII